MSDEGKKRRAARYKQYVANKNTTANKNAGEKKSTLRFPLMSADELNSFGGDNTNVKGYDYANRPIYANEVANHPERKKVFKDIVDKRVVADASEPFAKLDKDGNIVGIPNDNSAHKDVGKVFNNDKTNREKYTRTPLQEGYNREKALEEKKNKLREEYSTTLKPEIDTEVDDEVIKAINEKRLIQDEYNRQKAERERLKAENNKNPRWYEGWDGSLNTDMIDKANELSWKQIEGYDLDNADQRALAILKLSLPYSRARQSYVNQAKTISDRANQQGKGSMWQGVVDNLADFTGLDEAFSAIEMGKSARHYIREYERFNKIYNNSDQAREKAIQSLNKEDRANLEVFTAVQQVLAGNENELSNWYKAGQVTGDMLPFMLQLGASSTIVKGASRLLRRGAKKIAEKQMAEGISTALLNTAISPATQRAKNEEYANIRLFENRDITAKDRAKVYGQQAIENLTETVGVPLAKLGVQGTQRLFKGIGAKMLEKPMINRTFGKITKFAERPQQWIKIANKLGNNPVSKFLKDNLFFGGFGEEAFEEVEGALGNTVLGYLFDDEEMKQEFSNFWQADNLSVLALGLAPMTMFPLSFGISNAVVSHRDAKAYQQAREQLLGVLRQAGLGNKKIIDGLEGKIIEGKPHEVIETLSALRRAAQGAQNEKDIDEAIYNYIAGARRLNEQRNELNAQLQQMNNAQRKEYVDNIIENIHRQQKNNILYQGIKNGYYQELQDPQNGKKEKYICEVYNKNGTSIGFITDKEQDDNGNVLFTIVDGLGQVQRMTLDDIYRQAEGGEDANNPIVFTKVRDILDYLYEQAGEDEELRADIQTRNLLQDAIKRGADGSNVINVARLNDGGIMFLTDINEQAGTVTGLVQTQDGAYQPQQISLSEVAEAKEQNVEDLIDNTANIFNANIEADGILPQYTMPYYSSDLQANNQKEEIKTTPEETEKQRTTEEKESAFTVGDKVAVSVDKGNIDSYGEYDEYDGKEYEVKGVRGNQVILDIDGELRPININKQGVTLTKVGNNTEETETKEQGTTESEKAKEETETQKQEEKTKSLTERIKSGEILSQNAEETLVDLYSNMSKEDAQEVVNGIIKQTQDRQKQLAKKTINYEDIDKFQQHKKQVRETEKKLAYWNEVKSLFTAPLSQEEEVQSLKSIKEKESALGQAYSMREYILRNLALGAKFLWNDSENGTKGLGSHLGLRDSNEERRNYYAFLNSKDKKAVYPEVYAERLLTDVRENINPNVSFDEVFNEMIDCLSSYSTPTAMMDEAVRMHYEAEDNLTQNDFEKQQQAMIDRAEKREEDRIQDELNKQEALSEEDYERMRQGFDEQEKASEIYRSKEITPEQEALLRKPNSSQYQPVQELSAGKDSKNSENREEKGEKNDKEEQLRNELISLLKKAGIEVITDKKQADDVRKKAEEKARDIKTTAGEVYGFTVGGKIYIYTDIATSETPIHEYAHLFVKALKITNKQAWERLKEGLRKEKDLLSYVKNKYKGITDEDVLLSEVFATYAGKAGRERMQTDLKKELSQTKSNVEKMRIIQIFASLRKLLDRFWKMAKAMFEGEVAGVETMSVKDFSDMAMSSLLNGFNPVRVIQDATKNNPKSFGIEEDLDSRIDYQISRRNEEQIEKLLKKNANITDKEIEAFKQYVEHEQPVAQLSMAKWVGNGSVRLPEDKPTVDEALKICRKDKLDPMRYAAPGEIVKEWREKNIDEQEEQRQYLSPDSYPDVLTNKQDLGNGVTVYDVADTRAGQQAVRDLMNDHLTVDGRYYNCWCLLYASESTGELSSQAWGYWNNYNGTQKKVAFKDGKIVSFCASSSSHSEWWDLSDKSHGDKIPVEGKIPNDKLGRSSLMEVDMQTGKATPVGRKYSGNKKNGLYREWNKDDVLVLSENYKGRKRNGLCEYWYSNGQMMMRSNFKGGRYDGEYEYWYSNGQMMERSNYKDGKLNGLYEYWESNGQIMKRSNYKDGEFNGLFERWYTNGQMMERSNFKDGKLNGLYEYWDTNGQMKARSNLKDGKRIENLPITEDKGAPAPRWEDENERIKEDRSVKNITESESKRKGMLGVVLDALRKAIGKENVITDNRQAQRVIDEVNGRVRPERISNKEVNKRFNEELQQQIDGTLPKDHTYQLGLAGSVLQSAGVRALPIELRASRLTDKSMQENHPFELSDIKNLPNAIQEPIMVFDSANTAGRKVILTEIESRGNNFVVVLSAELKGNKLEVNRIRSLYPKDSVQGIVDWINAGNLLKYADKNKALEWIGKQQSNSADVTNTIKNLDVAAKVLQNFENPTIIEQKNEKNLKEHRLVGGNSGYVGYSMSKRAEQAREEGRYPKTDFKKVYNISDKTLKALVSAGIIDDNEWHHTSKYGNKTTFYGWSEEKFATIYRLFKKEIDAIVKENQPQPNPYKYTEWNEFSEEFQALPYNVKKDKGSKELQDFLKTHPEDKAKYEENERYNQWQAQAPSPIETTMIVSEKLNKFFDEKDVKFFKTKDGEAYGFTVGGKVYIDTKIADASTPIHEYTHLWAEALRKVNPKEWQNIVSLMKKQTHLWDKVKKDYTELKSDDEIADEVLAHYSGERGKKLLDEEYNKIRDNNKMNIFDKAKMLQAINNVREALRKFWKGVADFLGIHFTSAEEVADKVLSDLLEGVNPNEVKSATDNVGTFDSENADIRFHKSTERVVEKATDKALEEVKDPILKRAYKGILKESTKDKWASFADDYHALRVMEDKVIEEMRKRDPKFRLHHSVYEQQIAAKAATQGQIFLFSQQTFKPLLDKVDKIANKYNLSQKEVEQFMMFQFYRERTNDVIYNRWRETQDRIDAGRTPNKEYKEEYDAVKKYMGSLTDRERAEAERKANEIFGKIAEEKTFGSLEEMDEEFDQLKTEMYARAAADKYRQQELWDTNNKDGIRGFAGEESMCRTALYQTIAENYFPKEKGNMTTTRLTPDEIIEKFRDMVGKDNVDELNKLSRAVTQFTLDKALETGNITREEYEKYQRQEYYVPLRGWDKDDGEVSVFGNDTSFQSVNPNAKGRTTTADNPLKYMFVIASNQIHDFNEKQAKRSLINFINEYKDIIIGSNVTSYWSWNDKDNNKVYDVKRPKKNAYLKGTLEFHLMNDSYERVYPKTLKDYTFTFKDGDKTYNMYLPSKYLVKILNKDKQPDGKIIQWLSKGTRFLASMRTSKNPSFVAANFSRDALVVLLLDENKSKEFPHFRRLFLENLSKMQTVWRSEWKEGKAYRGSKMDNDVQKLYNQWVYYGGMSGYSFFLDDIEKEYEKRYKDLQRSTKSKVGQNVNPFSSQFLDIFNRFSEFTENQVRFAAFRAYLEASEIAGNPLTVQEAVYKSKEATLNFSRSGWGTRTLGKIFPFFNAAMQGIIKLARVLRYNPTRFWGAVSIAVGVGALDAFLSLILGGDDDKKNKYLQINDYVKERNLIIMRAMIPIPQELYIPFTIGVNLMEAYLGKKTVTEVASRIINALGELLPSEVGTSLGALVEYDRVNDRLKMTDHPFNTIISALAPGIVQPISDFNRNRDFMDRPILPKEPKEEGYNKKIAQAGRYDEYKTYKVFQDAAFYYNNLVSIITKHEPISWDREYYETLVGEGNKMAEKNGEIGKLRTVSPQAMQFFFGQYLPAISNIATKVGDIQAGRKALSGENLPIVDRLVVKHDKHASLYKKSSLVNDILDEQPNKKTLKKMKKAADDEHKERYDKAIQDRKTKVVERYNKNKDKLTRLRMEVKLLRIQGAVKNEKKIDELLDKQEEIYDKILRDWNKKE